MGNAGKRSSVSRTPLGKESTKHLLLTGRAERADLQLQVGHSPVSGPRLAGKAMLPHFCWQAGCVFCSCSVSSCAPQWRWQDWSWLYQPWLALQPSSLALGPQVWGAPPLREAVAEAPDSSCGAWVSGVYDTAGASAAPRTWTPYDPPAQSQTSPKRGGLSASGPQTDPRGKSSASWKLANP